MKVDEEEAALPVPKPQQAPPAPPVATQSSKAAPSGFRFAEMDLLDPLRWKVKNQAEVTALTQAWMDYLQAGGVRGAQFKEAQFLMEMVSIHAVTLATNPQDKCALQSARYIVARLKTLHLGATEGWGRAARFYATFFGKEPEMDDVTVHNMPEFLRGAQLEAARIPRRVVRETRGAKQQTCFRCGAEGHYANRCTVTK
eukprot:TRINITY_DN1286_c0_g2_i4.p4 TRINITY_DN1286_c0_g2~~TRINITY_DN1286_c0_g2_i4.p4  ORF type:complete len:199 (+),score=25.54 TRINITY_DN1286_c0_g2_i4:670-1266(+)